MMMKITTTTILLALVVLPRPAAAQERGSVSFVSGISMAQGSTLTAIASAVSPGVSSTVNLGGRLALNIAPGFQAVGEVGRLGNVLPPLVTSIVSLTPYDVRTSALYGEGGMRAFASPHSAVNPYVEATGGMARLNVRISGFNATTDDLLALGLGLTSRTSPMAGLGGGVMFHAGALTLDAGYRYKKIFAKNFIENLLSGGQELTSHQVAFGVGVRF
jgi:hypothetical protein